MSSKVEQMVLVRRRLLTNNLIGLVLWQGAGIAKELVPHGHPLFPALILASVGGAGYWMFTLWRITMMQKQLQNDQATVRAMEDELVRLNRLKAGTFALTIILLFEAFLTALLAFLPSLLSAAIVAQMSLLLGPASFIGAFIYLDAKE